MNFIAKLKSSVFADYYSNPIFLKNIGLRLFQLGVLILSVAPAISFLLLLMSSALSSFKRGDNYFKDKYNYPFLVVTILMIFNCIFLTLNKNNFFLLDISNVWIGLSNWLPFFWCFWGFQPYLESRQLRIHTSKLLIIGSLPVLLSGFCQYFLKMYGPYYFFNNLIIWYQRPLANESGVTGLFNNQNYFGAWLCIILPLCLIFLVEKNKNNFRTLLVFLLCLSFVYMIVLTSSRGAILSIFITIFLFTKSIKNKLFILCSLLSLPIFFKLIAKLSLNSKSVIFNFIPYELIKKVFLINLSDLNHFPRIEIWRKSLELIKSNPITGYGAGSFKSLYELSNGAFGEIQHSHNIFLEIAINHGLTSSLIISATIIFIVLNACKEKSNIPLNKSSISEDKMKVFDNAWIISFIVFLMIHIFDITYFDGRISTLAWILLAGMRSIIRERSIIGDSTLNKIY